MTFYKPPTKAERRLDDFARLRKRLTDEIRTADPTLSSSELERRVVHRMQNGPAPSATRIPKEVLDARRKERRGTVAAGKSARLGDKRPGPSKPVR